MHKQNNNKLIDTEKRLVVTRGRGVEVDERCEGVKCMVMDSNEALMLGVIPL